MRKQSSSFDGYQPKKYIESKNIWVKADKQGGEAIAETLVSEFLQSCRFAPRFVIYQLSKDKRSCASRNFLQPGESFIPFHRLVEALNVNISDWTDFDTKVKGISKVLSIVTSSECTSFVWTMLTIDVVMRNVDRHLSNFGVILSPNGSVRVAPLFDHGLSLGVSEGLYWDIGNLVQGLGYEIKPFENKVGFLDSKIDASCLGFDVNVFIRVHNPSLTSENRLFGGLLNILCKYFPKDVNGVDTRTELLRAFGDFRVSRYQVR